MIDDILWLLRYHWPEISIALLICGVSAAVIWVMLEDHKRWENFKAEHECKIVGYMDGDLSTGIGYGMTTGGQFGTVITATSTPSKTGWLCDDGMIYWK